MANIDDAPCVLKPVHHILFTFWKRLFSVTCSFWYYVLLSASAQSWNTESTYIQTQLRLDRINLLTFVALSFSRHFTHLHVSKRPLFETIDFIATCNKCCTTHIFSLVFASCHGNRNLIIAVHLKSRTLNTRRESQECFCTMHWCIDAHTHTVDRWIDSHALHIHYTNVMFIFEYSLSQPNKIITTMLGDMLHMCIV